VADPCACPKSGPQHSFRCLTAQLGPTHDADDWCQCSCHVPSPRPVRPSPPFDGRTYEPKHDGKRLGSQLERVRGLMADHRWRTLPELRRALGDRDSEAALSARLRDLRKQKFGGLEVERRRRPSAGAARGLWEYRVQSPVDGGQLGLGL